MGLAERLAFYGGLLAALGLLVALVAGPGTASDPAPGGLALAAGAVVAALGCGATLARVALT